MQSKDSHSLGEIPCMLERTECKNRRRNDSRVDEAKDLELLSICMPLKDIRVKTHSVAIILVKLLKRPYRWQICLEAEV